MNYTIASMKDVHSEYDWEIFFDKDGSKYTVAARYLKNDEHDYKFKIFDDKKDAIAFWNQQSEIILNCEYSKEDRLAFYK